MEKIEYTFADKASWGRGPWDSEPDKVQWPDAETGLPCLAVRNDSGAWCGYVGVAEGHAYFGLSYDDDEISVDVHGGLTFADFCSPYRKEHGICHVVGEGENDRVWWLGFDCAHANDRIPLFGTMGELAQLLDLATSRGPLRSYRTLEYVQAECARLARQLASVK